MSEFLEVIISSLNGFASAYKNLWQLLNSNLTFGEFVSNNLPDGLSWVGSIAELLLQFNITDLLWFSVGFYIAFTLVKWIADVVN